MLDATESAGTPDPADLKSSFIWVRDRQRTSGGAWRAAYAWSILSAAQTAQALRYDEVSVLEFGVAGGRGLLAMEAAAEAAEAVFGVGLSVYGFDTGEGLPSPTDHRDAPFVLREGDFSMDESKLRSRLKRATLVLGDVAETVRGFQEAHHAPIAFISFDLDYYSSTMDALVILEGRTDRLLPRVACYFDDLHYPPWTSCIGEAAAISDFNASHEMRKIAALPGLRHGLPRSESRARWPERIHLAEIFDHERYAEPVPIAQPDLGLRD